ncbi:hypothetical protein [Halorhodospira halochloris]|uniref:hypothetical protein n=1 Tax=Halorhodospira halochloris TaxID=1052 RepID=UPI001EE8999A|nr:hypothetical protein [Halorhodospira halochloris]MCG5549196.1 hypothetical protein [Halorhodospira halochloris]
MTDHFYNGGIHDGGHAVFVPANVCATLYQGLDHVWNVEYSGEHNGGLYLAH